MYPATDNLWMMRLRCRACKEAHFMTDTDWLNGLKRKPKDTDPNPFSSLSCQNCGGVRFDDPRMGRRKPFRFFDPRTWFGAPWEWNDSTVVVLPSMPETPQLNVLPFTPRKE